MFRINGIDWEILLVSSNHPMLKMPNGFYSIGACDEATKTIYICDELTLSKMKKVLYHEIAHAVMISYRVYLSNREEELLADLIATYGQEIIDIANKIFRGLY